MPDKRDQPMQQDDDIRRLPARLGQIAGAHGLFEFIEFATRAGDKRGEVVRPRRTSASPHSRMVLLVSVAIGDLHDSRVSVESSC